MRDGGGERKQKGGRAESDAHLELFLVQLPSPLQALEERDIQQAGVLLAQAKIELQRE